LQQGSTVLFSQSQERRKQRKNRVRTVGLDISSVLVGKDAENAKPVVVSTPYAVASSDAADVVVEPSAPPPDAVPKPGEVPQELLYVMPGSLQYEAGYLGGISENTRSGETTAAATGLSPISYLTRILVSKVYDVAIETPLELAPKLNEKIGAQIHLKREDMQPASTILLHHLFRVLLLS
jgi:threonine dehydratase